MTEIEVYDQDKQRSFRFRETTDIGTYYQVFGLEGIKLLLRSTGFGSLEHIKNEAQAEYDRTDIDKQREHMRAEYVRKKLFEAVRLLTDAQIKRV